MLGGHVNRGEHGTKIIYWNVINQTVHRPEHWQGEEEKRFFCKEYTVFNLDQCGGEALNRFRLPGPCGTSSTSIPPKRRLPPRVPMSGMAATEPTSTRSSDYIQLPVKEAFESPAAYYATALHELSHWTGHESRLNRIDKLARFGDGSMQPKSLLPNLAGAFLTAALGIPNERTLGRCHRLSGPLAGGASVG